MWRDVLSVMIAAWMTAFLVVGPVVAASPCPCCVSEKDDHAGAPRAACCAEHADKTPLANCKPASALNLPEQSPSCPHCELQSHQVDASRIVRSAEPVEWGFFAALIAETGETIVPVVPRLPSTERLKPIDVPTHQERQAQLCRWLA
ncbi:MAG: hypothetical protein KF777_07765 [Planctomycetaceae bacterium]|nr:hypothetical protein [Planctomycetaceae bacterium]